MRFFVTLFVACLGLLLPFTSFARGRSGGTFCDDSYRRDSYGRGLDAGFRGGDLRPRLVDEGCYQLGFNRGARTRTERHERCESLFDEGYRQGFAGEGERLSSGGPCHSLGYSAGRAALGVSLREGRVDVVGESCMRNYSDGYRAALQWMSAVYPSSLATCYAVGYEDGQIFR